MPCYLFKLGPLRVVFKHLRTPFANFLAMTWYESPPLLVPFRRATKRVRKGYEKGAFGQINERVPVRNPFRGLSYPFIRFGGYEKVRKGVRKGGGFRTPFRTF